MTKNLKKITAEKKKNFFFIKLQFTYPKASIKYVQVTEEAFSSQDPTFQNMNLKKVFLLLWVIFALLDPDPADSESGSGSTDPIESGSNPDPQPCLQVVGHVLDSINLDARERGRSIEFRDLYYVYVNEDPRYGMTYILDLLLVYKKFKGNKVTMKVRRHLYVRQPLLEPLVRPLSMEEFITPSGGPA
jgi:hypothetical protein